MLQNIKEIDQDVLQVALRKEGITENRFLDFLETTDAFAVMKRSTERESAGNYRVTWLYRSF